MTVVNLILPLAPSPELRPDRPFTFSFRLTPVQLHDLLDHPRTRMNEHEIQIFERQPAENLKARRPVCLDMKNAP